MRNKYFNSGLLYKINMDERAQASAEYLLLVVTAIAIVTVVAYIVKTQVLSVTR